MGIISPMKYLFALFFILFTGCATKSFEQTQSKIFIIKSPQIKFADLGFLRYGGEHIQLELFSAGKVVQRIDINHLVCVNEGCMSKSAFNADYLSPHYPSDTLAQILLGRAIFEKEGYKKTDEGFEQRLINADVNIIYRVTSQEIYFKDKLNNIIIKIKETTR